MSQITCPKCVALKHYACAGKRGGSCACNICKSSRPRDIRTASRAPRRRPSKPSQYKPRKRIYSSSLTGDRAEVRKAYGILTDFNMEQVELIFRRKRAGGPNASISAIARELDTTRDRVRTVYNASSAPRQGCRECGRPY